MKKILSFILVVIIILGIIYLCYLFWEKFSGPRFLSKPELYDLLSRDDDGYFARFNENDLRVRGVGSVAEYKEKIWSSCSEFTDREKELLRQCTQEARIRMQSGMRSGGSGGLDPAKALRIPIIFGCITGKGYEEGLPHTRLPAIIIGRRELDFVSPDFLVRLILHELTHLYQKIYPADVREYLKQSGFEVVRKRRAEDNLRANPDVDGFVYKNTLTDVTYEFVYKENPRSIGDVVKSGEEHPFEEMAYRMENL